MRHLLLLLATCLAVSAPVRAAPESDAVRSAMLRAYTDNLIEAHQDEERSKRQLNEVRSGPDQINQIMSAIVRNGTTTKMNLGVAISRLENIHISDEHFVKMIPYMIEGYRTKIGLYDELTTTAKTMLAGPEPGVDYGKIAAHVPEVTAQLDFINKTLFTGAPLVSLFLVSQKPDSKNRLSHLGITRKEAQTVIHRLQAEFGKSMDSKNQSWTTSSASLLRDVLRDKGYLFADDPWN